MNNPIKCSDIILIHYVAKSYTMSTRRFQQHSITKFFIRTISFEFHVTSQVSKHCRIISVVFIITYALKEETYSSRKTHQRILFLLFWSSKIYKNVRLTYQGTLPKIPSLRRLIDLSY